MYKGYTVVGQRGQITIPKEIRKKIKIKEKDKLLVTLKANNLIIKKIVYDKEINALMVEGYKKMAAIDKETVNDFENVDSEANDYIGEY
jgi:AbrB family looped-hinge helix DNA binding protein